MKLQNITIGLLLALSLDLSAASTWSLDQAIGYSLTNSPDARLAQQRINAARAGLGQANAAFSPQVQFASSYMRSDSPMQAFGFILNQRSFDRSSDFNKVPETDNVNVKGLVSVPLYAGGRNTAARDSAKANTQAAKQTAQATRNTLAFEVSRAYFTILKAREFIRATEAGVRDFETNAAMASTRLSTGTLLKPEALDVEVRLAHAREDLARARNAHALALRAFRNLLGIEQGEIDVAESTPATSAPDTGDFLARPELGASRYRQDAVQAEYRKASSGYKPRLSAFASGDYDYGPRTRGDGTSYTAGVMVQWDLWDGFLTRSKRAETKANLEMAREEDRKLRLELDLELEQARLALREATERLSVTEKVVQQASESVTLTRARFNQGLAGTTQLIDSETALISARVRRAEAEADHHIAVAAVRKALGLPQIESSK